jgi:hypothetical protein
VLITFRIEDGERWWELPTGSRDGGGDRAAGGDRSREIGREKKGENARTGTREVEKAPGVQKKRCPCSSRCWRLGGARGSRGGVRAGAM